MVCVTSNFNLDVRSVKMPVLRIRIRWFFDLSDPGKATQIFFRPLIKIYLICNFVKFMAKRVRQLI
jgi:hypothetical protein